MPGVGRSDGGFSGGARPKAGRPRRKPSEIKPGRLLSHPSSPPLQSHAPADLDESDAPNDLSVDERLIWMELGAMALGKGRTLAAIKSYPFRLLVTNVALERRYAKSVTEAGSANHRGMIQAIDRELMRFGLVDLKIEPVKQPAANPFAAFGGSK